MVSAGLARDLFSQQPVPITTGPPSNTSTQAELPVTAMSSDALSTVGATLSSGRFYDHGADLHHHMVALLGSAAAEQLGIDSARGGPAITINGVVLTVVGIVSGSQQELQSLLGIVVPPYVAEVIAGPSGQRRVIVRTEPGAAQVIGNEGPMELDPYQPAQVSPGPPQPIDAAGAGGGVAVVASPGARTRGARDRGPVPLRPQRGP